VSRLFFLTILLVLLERLALIGLSDTDISVADTSIPNNEITNSVSKNS